MRLHIFNPHTDLALANNRVNYMPSANVRRMVCELEMLPMWFAAPGDSILTTSPTDNIFAEKAKELFGINVNFIDESKASGHSFSSIEPWGWNVSLRRRLSNIGINEKLLPTDEQLANYRSLSGRDKDVELLNAICGKEGIFNAEIINNIEECRKYASEYPRCIFKAPWSGSGKGLRWCFGVYDEKSDGWCRRVIEEQGFLTATPIYDKILDFALEYHSDGNGGIKFIGYSLFDTNTKGAYRGNILQRPDRQRETLSKYIPLSTIDNTRESVQKQLKRIYGNKYHGYLGVDMMVCKIGDTYAIHPCVEVNMRMNMGVLSVIFAERYLADVSRATFMIEYHNEEGYALRRLNLLCKEHPLCIEDGKIVSGAMPLVPIGHSNNYIAYILAKRQF